jgi:hypothetical protein
MELEYDRGTVEENLRAERESLEEIKARTGLEFPRLQLVDTFRGPELAELRRVAADMIPRQSNAVCRRILYAVFGPPVAREYLELILAWHEGERVREAFEVIERVLLLYVTKSTRDRIYQQMLSHPTKLCLSGLLYLVKQARTDRAVLQRLRAAFDGCLLDLVFLGFLAARDPDLYDFLSGGEGCGRLSGGQCQSVLCWQVPENDRHFIRAKFVPNYGIVGWAATAEGDRVTRAPGEVTDVEGMQLRRLGEGESQALRIDVRESEGVVRTVVVTRLAPDGAVARGRGHRHRRRAGELAGKYWVGAVEAPIPPEWNLVPKRVLPLDSPLRTAWPPPRGKGEG